MEGGDTTYIKENWLKESNIQLQMETWKKIIANQWESTSALSWRKFGWKSTIRFFRVPAQKSCPREGTLCRRSCGENKATHFHVFWNCPVISNHWKDTNQIMEKIMKVVVPLTFETLCLGLIPDTVKGPKNKYIYNILSLASKKAITRNWLSKNSPMVGDWIKVVQDIFKVEKIPFLLRQCSPG